MEPFWYSSAYCRSVQQQMIASMCTTSGTKGIIVRRIDAHRGIAINLPAFGAPAIDEAAGLIEFAAPGTSQRCWIAAATLPQLPSYLSACG
jgi:hypothetical protein